MSRIKHRDAMLAGYKGPYFPGSIAALQDELERSNATTNHWLVFVARSIGGVSSVHGHTTDGYTWFSTIKLRHSTVVILIPWSQDWEKTDGLQADRSAALYIKRGTVASADKSVVRFTNAVRRRINADERAQAQAERKRKQLLH